MIWKHTLRLLQVVAICLVCFRELAIIVQLLLLLLRVVLSHLVLILVAGRLLLLLLLILRTRGVLRVVHFFFFECVALYNVFYDCGVLFPFAAAWGALRWVVLLLLQKYLRPTLLIYYRLLDCTLRSVRRLIFVHPRFWWVRVLATWRCAQSSI